MSTIPPSSRQWKRVAQVVIGKNGKGLMVQNLRIYFEILKTVEPSPNTALIKLYNLNPTNESHIKNEYDEVLVNAGYQDSVRLIFRGNIKHVFRFRDQTDYITEVEAADGDKDFRNAYMNLTLAKGTDASHVITKALASFTDTGKGFIGISGNPRVRGRVISGNTRDVLSDLARNHGANWSIQDGQLTIVKADGVLPDQAIVINSDTGLLGAPEINDKGIGVLCLLNPQIKINGVIQLDNNNIKEREKRKPLISHQSESKPEVLPRLDPDGLYKVIQLKHSGDTYDQKWTTELVCVSLSQPIPVGTRR